METLQSIFPDIPEQALLYALRICDSSVQEASHWLLENSWEDIQLEATSETNADNDTLNTGSNEASSSTYEGGIVQMGGAIDSDTGGDRHLNEDEFDDDDDDDDDDEDEDEDEDEEEDEDAVIAAENGDEDFYASRVAPLAKRQRITEPQSPSNDPNKEEKFWVCFDDQIVEKSLIDLLNTSLIKLAHGRVLLSNLSTKEVNKESAKDFMTSIAGPWNKKKFENDGSSTPPGEAPSDKEPSFKPKQLGYWAYIFSVSEVDMVWRSLLHAHLFNKRFGRVVEFHTIWRTGIGHRGFDELMHCYVDTEARYSTTLGVRRTKLFKCCLLLPCVDITDSESMEDKSSNDEVYRVGKNVHTTLKLKDPLYFRTCVGAQKEERTTPSCYNPQIEGKMNESQHKSKCEYRIVKAEVDSGNTKTTTTTSSSILRYQPKAQVKHTLQVLGVSGWSTVE